MIQHIKICLCLLCFTFVSCKQTKDDKSIIASINNKEKQLEINSPVENHEKNYEVWYFSTKNISDKYSDFQILIAYMSRQSTKKPFFFKGMVWVHAHCK